jgi:hypothetical protein
MMLCFSMGWAPAMTFLLRAGSHFALSLAKRNGVSRPCSLPGSTETLGNLEDFQIQVSLSFFFFFFKTLFTSHTRENG